MESRSFDEASECINAHKAISRPGRSVRAFVIRIVAPSRYRNGISWRCKHPLGHALVTARGKTRAPRVRDPTNRAPQILVRARHCPPAIGRRSPFSSPAIVAAHPMNVPHRSVHDNAGFASMQPMKNWRRSPLRFYSRRSSRPQLSQADLAPYLSARALAPERPATSSRLSYATARIKNPGKAPGFRSALALSETQRAR